MSNSAGTKKRTSSRSWRKLHPGDGQEGISDLSVQADEEQGKDSLCDSVRAIRAGFDAGAWGLFRQQQGLETVQYEQKSFFRWKGMKDMGQLRFGCRCKGIEEIKRTEWFCGALHSVRTRKPISSFTAGSSFSLSD